LFFTCQTVTSRAAILHVGGLGSQHTRAASAASDASAEWEVSCRMCYGYVLQKVIQPSCYFI